ncbi:HAD hydrolase family protein [Motiliproteus sediminis]|uniref:HAD hydrolase family protein n=1 Tax=Motiliproteus sediminis TaxID=1468178 RepID=UPI001AEF37E6|nr:HAD hydrolase family protein [Motiliproteus sediminis]
MKKLVIDLDGTLTIDAPGPYPDKEPNAAVVEKLRQYQRLGFQIVIYTARNMRTYEGNVGQINVHTLPVILDWLAQHRIPFDEVIVGKPWCGTEGFYVDDKALRPSEFAALSPAEVKALLDTEATAHSGAK